MSKKLPVLDALAAFVDVGSEHMHVSVGGGAPEVFGTVTSQLHALRDSLLAQGVRSVAMEATGVYWLPLYSVLEAAGLAVRMVNGRQTRNAPGRKTDMQDAQWGATLHMLHDVISSLAGTSGMAMARAIVAGERSPQALLALCYVQIRRKKASAVLEALRGTWADEHVFALGQALQSWDHYQRLIVECDSCIAAVLPALDATRPALAKTTKRVGVNAPEISKLREILAQMCGGRDLTRLPALSHYGVLQLVGEVGTDLSLWPSEKHFTSWTGLAPGNHDSGKRKGHARR